MSGKLKFHAIAIAIICGVIIILYGLVGPKAPPATEGAISSDRAIEIYGATWGEGCNPAIAKAIALRNTTLPPKDAAGNLIPQPPLEHVVPNNVLTTVSDLCNGKSACSITATSAALASNPISTCFKRLVLSYRCFSYDRLTRIELGEGETKGIDCNAAPSPAAQ